MPDKVRNRIICVLDGRNEGDVFPTYYKVNTPEKIREIARSTDFSVHEIKMIVVSQAHLAVIPPLAIVELLLTRILMKKPLEAFRTNIIGVLQKPASIRYAS